MVMIDSIRREKGNKKDFIECAKREVARLLSDRHRREVATDKIYVVWQCKALRNYKAILAADTLDELLFEVTYNGEKGEMYVDTYDKIQNAVIFDD